jgi:GNAT superfamily N-acetyltransferase
LRFAQPQAPARPPGAWLAGLPAGRIRGLSLLRRLPEAGLHTMPTIRPLPREERHRLAPLLALYAAEMRDTLAGAAVAPPEAQAALLAAHPAAEVLLAEDDAAPLGFAILFDLPEVVFARRCGMLDDLFVRPEARGRGIARALIAEAVALGRARGWSHLRWIVPEADAGAIALYERIAERADWRSYVIRLDPGASL